MRAEISARVFQRRNEPRQAKIAIIHRFWRQLCVISIPFEIFRRLNALFTALCVQVVVHAISSVETSPDTRKPQSFVDSDNNYALFLSRLRYFVVLTLFSLHDACRTECTRFPASKRAQTHENSNNSSILTTIMRNFSPVWNISSL